MKKALLGIALFSLTAATVHAVPLTYTYTGHEFTSIRHPYTTSMRIEAQLNFAGPLPIGQSAFIPLSFSFTDGVHILTESNSTIIDNIITLNASESRN